VGRTLYVAGTMGYRADCRIYYMSAQKVSLAQ
jgi:hypothetical protein